MKVVRQCMAFDVDSKELKAYFLVLLEGSLSPKTKSSGTFKNTLAGFKKALQWAEKQRVPGLEVH